MKKYILIIAVFFSIGISGCKKDFLSLEVNPNQPSVSPPQLTLSGALVTAVAIVNTGANYSNYGVWAGYMTRSGNYVPSPALEQFQITNTTYTGIWTALYQNLTNFNNLQVSSAKDPSLANFQAIAMIMKVYDFEQLVDMFGNVAYSQAFQPSTILTPAYDDQQAIYNDLVKQLDAAMALAGKSGASLPGASDVVFGATKDAVGEMGCWKKFANSLKLRLAIRQSTKNSSNAAAAALAATAKYGYLDGATDAQVNPGYANQLSAGASQQSPFYASYGFDTQGNQTGNAQYYRASQFYINILTNLNDPRLSQVYAPATGSGVIAGSFFGDPNAKSNPSTSSFGPGLLKSPTQNAYLMSGAESLFLQAEALVDGYAIGGAPTTPTTAQAAYQAAITASFVQLGAFYIDNSVVPAVKLSPAASAAVYYAQANNANWANAAGTAAQLQTIVMQKWIANVGYANLEGYLEYERTGIPALPNPVSIAPGALSNTLPVRQYYPLSEVNSNPASVTKQGNINIFTTKIFWEK